MFRNAFKVLASVFALVSLATCSGVYALWEYTHSLDPVHSTNQVSLNEFQFLPDMPNGEVSLTQRLGNILNQAVTIPGISDVREYLINDTIQVYWEPGAPPYVGSMDKNFEEQIYR